MPAHLPRAVTAGKDAGKFPLEGYEVMNVGLVGWRGMVGSVLMQRMQQEGDFDLIEPVFFSTSNAGGNAPSFAKTRPSSKMQQASKT